MRPILLGLAAAVAAAAPRAGDEPDPFRGYEGKEPVPAGLREAYTEFAKAARAGAPERFCLPHAVEVTRDARPVNDREYGRDMNLPFLRDGFSPRVVSVRKDPDDCYLVRTGTSAIGFVQTKSGAWKVYRYYDKPIE
jgi:hypothetical protein